MIPTAEEFMKLYYEKSSGQKLWTSLMIEFAKLHVEAALQKASENSVLESRTYSKFQGKVDKTDNLGQEINLEGQLYLGINKDSILNAYPPENIK